jgi:hypothetical protein
MNSQILQKIRFQAPANPVIHCGLIAGALGGETIVLLVLVNTILLKNFAAQHLLQNDPVVATWITAYPLLVIAIFEIWGVCAAWLARLELSTWNDALITGFIAGILIGIILEIMWIANILSMVAHEWGQRADFFLGYGNTFLIIGILILFVLMGGILSGFGSYIFYISKTTAGVDARS